MKPKRQKQIIELIDRQVAISLLRIIVDYREYCRSKETEPTFDDLAKMLEWAMSR